MLKRKERFAFKAQLNIAVLIELYGTITLRHSLLHLILSIVRTLLDTSMLQITKYYIISITIKLLHSSKIITFKKD